MQTQSEPEQRLNQPLESRENAAATNSNTEMSTSGNPASGPVPESIARPEEDAASSAIPTGQDPVTEYGGVSGPDPTRYGDWEKNGRCVDF